MATHIYFNHFGHQVACVAFDKSHPLSVAASLMEWRWGKYSQRPDKQWLFLADFQN